MKQIIFIFLIFTPFTSIKADLHTPLQKLLPDGLYYADVAYYNYATYVSADYNLKVKIKDGMVIVIYLNNGGIVHYGINNEGYMFTGGKLDVNKDKHTGKLEYSTQVSISNGQSISSYSILISKDAESEQKH